MDIEVILNLLSDKTITKVIAGGSNGSIIILDIGHLEFSLFVKCVWRLDQENKALTGWNESNLPTGNLTKKIKDLKGEKIKKIEINGLYDMKIYFVSGKLLNIFCDVTAKYQPNDYDENWVLSDIINNKSYVINNKHCLIIRNYE